MKPLPPLRPRFCSGCGTPNIGSKLQWYNLSKYKAHSGFYCSPCVDRIDELPPVVFLTIQALT